MVLHEDRSCGHDLESTMNIKSAVRVLRVENWAIYLLRIIECAINRKTPEYVGEKVLKSRSLNVYRCREPPLP